MGIHSANSTHAAPGGFSSQINTEADAGQRQMNDGTGRAQFRRGIEFLAESNAPARISAPM
jgi:hypothetical protein